MSARTCSVSRLLPVSGALIGLAMGCSGLNPSVPTGEVEVGDAVLGLQVRVALLEQLGAEALNVAVDVHENAVTLSGQVRVRPNQQTAVEIASNVEGVHGVENRIDVLAPSAGEVSSAAKPADLPARDVADTILEAKVKKNLLQEMGRPALVIAVEAVDGTVSLRGALEDGELCERAIRTAENTQGVKSIQDLLEVG